MVTFEYLNLADDVFPSPLNNTNAMDLIFCRNVLMYFTNERTKHVVNGLYNSLVEGGYLIVSASELSYQNFSQFLSVNFPGAIVYRKSRCKASRKADFHLFDVPIQKDLFKVNPEPAVEFEQVIPQYKQIAKEPLKPVEIKLPLQTKYEEALNLYSQGYYSKVIDTFGNNALTQDELTLLIRAYANQGNLTDAISLCEKAISIDKLEPKIHHLYATILQEHNQLNEAVTSLKHAIYLDPNFVLSYYSLGNLFLKLGNLPGAKKCYKNILSILDKCGLDEILPDSEGLTTGRFKEIIYATIQTRFNNEEKSN
jgi:chemotaxis protein methyltransferase CheR